MSKLEWIKQKQEEIQKQERETERKYISGESYFLFGKQYRLRVVAFDGPCSIHREGKYIIMAARKEMSTEKKAEAMREWYRTLLKKELDVLVMKWSAIMEEADIKWQIKQMRTEWGSCSQRKRELLFNLELARIPLSCVEYVIVHEIAHLKVRLHNHAFNLIMSHYLPLWRQRKTELNKFMASEWKY